MTTRSIKVITVDDGCNEVVFEPAFYEGVWRMDITDQRTKETATVSMDDFLKVCRAFVADAENYK